MQLRSVLNRRKSTSPLLLAVTTLMSIWGGMVLIARHSTDPVQGQPAVIPRRSAERDALMSLEGSPGLRAGLARAQRMPEIVALVDSKEQGEAGDQEMVRVRGQVRRFGRPQADFDLEFFVLDQDGSPQERAWDFTDAEGRFEVLLPTRNVFIRDSEGNPVAQIDVAPTQGVLLRDIDLSR